MTLFLVLATLIFILLIYLSFKRWDVLHAMIVHQNTAPLQKYLNGLEDNSQSGLLITEVSELKDREARKALLNELPLATYVFSGITGRGKFVNPAFEQLLGYNLNEIPTVVHYMQLIFPNKNYRRYVKNELDTICWENKKGSSIFRYVEVYVSVKDGSKKCISHSAMFKGNRMWY